MSSQQSLIDTDESVEFELIKSYQSFAPHFEDAIRLRCITFCDSPELLLQLFDEFDLQKLEVVVGDVTDYRQRLREEDLELVDRLETLKREGKLLIYTCPSKTVHSKMYVIENADGSLELMTGSANLTRSAWRNQANHLARLTLESPGGRLHDRFMDHYREQLENYGELFLEDLTEELEESEDEDREEVIRYWLEGRETSRDEIQELNVKATEQLKSQDDEQDIVLSLNGFSDSTRESIRENFTNLGGSVGSDVARISPPNYSQYLKKLFGIPHMRLDENGLHFIPPGDSARTLTNPPGSPDEINDALDNLEAYFESVENFGETNHPRAVKMHMFEALLYFFWAPFVNLQAHVYRTRGIEDLNKNIPFLYLYGESNSGKGTFARFALRLISDNRVSSPIDADEVGQANLRSVRRANSSFPLVVDDIDKRKINRLDPLKNYWLNWDDESRFPTAIFISNDRKPHEWFRNRAKILHFDVMFRSTKKGEAEVNRIINEPNPLYGWIAHDLLNQFNTGQIELEDDLLAPVRSAVRGLYDRVDRSLPDYFPEQPAEQQFDIGRNKWQQLRRNTNYTTARKDGTLRISFGDELEFWEIDELGRHLPPDVRSERQGHDLVIKNPETFYDWLDRDTESAGLLSALRKLFGR